MEFFKPEQQPDATHKIRRRSSGKKLMNEMMLSGNAHALLFLFISLGKYKSSFPLPGLWPLAM